MTENEKKLILVIFDLLNDLNNDIAFESEVDTIGKICEITGLNKMQVNLIANDFYSFS